MFHLYLPLISLLFLIITLKLFFIYTTRTFKNLPPGPQCLPIIGNLHLLKQPLHRTFHNLSQKHGKLFSLWFGSRLVVVVSSLKLAQECFTKNDIVLANRPHFLTGKYIGYNNTTVVQSPYGDHWRNLRRILSIEILSSYRLNSFLEIRTDEIMRLVQKLAQMSYNDFAEVELRPMFSEMTFNTIMRMVSGKRYYGNDCDVSDVEEARLFREIIKEIVSLGGANNVGDFLGFLRLFDFDGLEKRLKKISKRTDSFLQGLIDEHRFGKRNTNTMIDHLLTQQQSQPEYYTDQIIKGLIVPLGRLPTCFAREFGGAIPDYVILRDPCHNEFEVCVVRESGVVYFGDGWHSLKDAYDIKFGAWVTLTYVSPILLAIRVMSRWFTEVDYPNYDPPLRHLLARSDPRCRIGSSVVNICSSSSSRPKSLILSYVKDLTLYDIHSGVLVLPWYGFGESAFAFVFSDLILVDNAGVQYKCGLKFGVNGSGELSCNVSGGWHDLCVNHAVVEGDRVKFSIAHYFASNVMYVSIYPRIRVEDYLKLGGPDSYISQV